MDALVLTEQLLAEISPDERQSLIDTILPAFSSEDSALLIDCLYQHSVSLRDAGRPDMAFVAGDLITQIGQVNCNFSQMALGQMVCGDALNAKRDYKNAWRHLEQAAELFQQDGNEIGWARTVIGRLLCAIDVEKTAQTLADFKAAETIFQKHGEYKRLAVLYLNAAILKRTHTQFEDAVQYLHNILSIAARHPEVSSANIPYVLNMLGIIHSDHGELRQATSYHQQAFEHFRALDHHRGQATALQNIADHEKKQGRYREALKRLDELLRLIGKDVPDIGVYAITAQIQCYLELNDYAQTQTLARSLLEDADLSDTVRAPLLTCLAKAYAEQGKYSAAQLLFNQVQETYGRLGLEAPAMQSRLHRGQTALCQGDWELALSEAAVTVQYFAERGLKIEEADARLLTARALWLSSGDRDSVGHYCEEVMQIAKECDSPSHLYGAHLLLGHVKLAHGNWMGAQRAYEAAAAVVDDMQRDLTIMLRPGFLGDKGEALRALIKLHLDCGFIGNAFEALERSKAQVFFSYLVGADSFHWTNDQTGQLLQQELNELRGEYQAFLKKAQEEPSMSAARSAAQVGAARKKELVLKKVRELYNRSSAQRGESLLSIPSLSDIQACLSPEALLIVYYDDGSLTHAFSIDAQSIEHHPLAASKGIREQLGTLEKRIDRAIAELRSVELDAEEASPLSILQHPAVNDARLRTAFNRSATALHQALIKPLANRLKGHQRLFIVPYGHLHYLPFHLLYDSGEGDERNGRYLIEDHEVILLPAASLLTRRAPKPKPGALIVHDSWNGALRHSARDAKHVYNLLGGETRDAATLDLDAIVQRQTRQVLHVVAHGAFDRENPELSYIQLGERQLTIHDLFRYDMGYSLVTLTACETGRLKLTEFEGKIAAGDDMIGLGRAFLYAGASSLLTSHWLIGDGLTLPLIERFYTALLSGATKAAAIRSAQLDLLAQIPTLHPVFWGVCQLIGDAGVLSSASA